MGNPFRKATKFWTTKDGKRVRVCDMSDTHLENLIALLERAAHKAYDKAVAEGYGALSGMNGDMAQFLLGNDLDNLQWREFLHPIYDSLIQDRARRTYFK